MEEQRTAKQAWLSGISNMFQFILGFLVGVALIAGTAAGAAYYYFKKISSNVPEKPVYTEETVAKQEESTEKSQDSGAKDNTEAQKKAPEPVASKPEIPEGSYYASVTWPQGLSLRAEPSNNAARIGGISYNAKILILEDSADKKWQRVQIPWSKQEGWVKGGNTKRTSY